MSHEPMLELSDADLDAVVGGGTDTSFPYFKNPNELEKYIEGQFNTFHNNMQNFFESYDKTCPIKCVNK